MTIRRMEREDLDAVLEIARASFDPSWDRAQFEVERERAFATCSVIEEAGVVVAYAVAWILAGELEVLAVATHPAHRRAGHAQSLVRSILDEARARGASRGFLEVREDNAAAIGLYAALGFAPDTRRARYYADGTDALIMVWQAAT
jgi:ribosomal-protein-alanine N-acetyltransferase